MPMVQGFLSKNGGTLMHCVIDLLVKNYDKDNVYYNLRSDMLYVVSIMELEEQRNVDRLYSYCITRGAVNAYLDMFKCMVDIAYDTEYSSCYKGTAIKNLVKNMLLEYNESGIKLNATVTDILSVFYGYIDKRVCELPAEKVGLKDAADEEELQIAFAKLGFTYVNCGEPDEIPVADESLVTSDMFDLVSEYGADRYFIKVSPLHTLAPYYRMEYDSAVPFEYAKRHLCGQWAEFSRSMCYMYAHFGDLFPAQ